MEDYANVFLMKCLKNESAVDFFVFQPIKTVLHITP